MPNPPFTDDELETLFAVFDTVAPAIDPQQLLQDAPNLAAEVDPATIAAFAADTPSQNPYFRQMLIEVIPAVVPPPKFVELQQVIGLLRGRIGTLILTSGFTPFHKLSIKDREAVLLGWKNARLPLYRKIYDSLVKLGVVLYMRTSEAAHKAMLYDPPVTAVPAEGHHAFEFLTPAQAAAVTFDAIIVGSGSGGGVAVKHLSEAGMRVLVVEKGQHYDHAGQVHTEAQAWERMYERAGCATNDYGDLALVSAAVFGGGSTVNWAASLQPPRAVREDWVKSSGIAYFNTPAFQADLDAVCKQMGVSLPKKQNMQNAMLLEGARRLGYAHAEVPQNNGGGDHECNHDCANHCRSGGKRGGVHCWLVDAAAAGAKFVTGVLATKIIIENGTAKGVSITANGQDYTLTAPRIIAAGGSMQTPALLLRSGIPNPRIGATLYLHPTNYVHGVFPDRTHPTSGQILTSVVGEYANLTPSGHGVRLETGCMLPAIALTLMQWAGGAQAKARIAKHPHMAGLIAIARDSAPGRVVLDTDGEPLVHYTVSARDAKSVVTGTLACAEILRVMGAEEIIVGARGVAPWKAGEDFEAFKRAVEKTPTGCYGSAHQMASCAMGSAGACDEMGALRGVKGVWVADASVLPSASGVNPMVSTMAVARKVALGLVGEWSGKPAEVVAAKL